MGFSSIDAKGIVEVLSEKDLLKKGAGHCVYIAAQNKQISIHEAGLLIQNGEQIEFLMEHFKQYE